MGDFLNVLKEVFTVSGDGKKVSEVATPPSDTTGFTEVLKSVFSIDTARTLTEEVLPGTSDVVSAKRAVDSLGEAGAAIRRGDVPGALKGYADAATNAVGVLPMVPAFGGILTGARGAAKGISEIPDKTSFFDRDKFKSLFKEQKGLPITEVYKNDALYEMYPELKDMKVTGNIDLESNGLYEIGSKNIQLKGYTPEETFIHELQHAVDDIETGGNFMKNYPSDLNFEKQYDTELSNLAHDLFQYLGDFAKEKGIDRKEFRKLFKDKVGVSMSKVLSEGSFSHEDPPEFLDTLYKFANDQGDAKLMEKVTKFYDTHLNKDPLDVYYDHPAEVRARDAANRLIRDRAK